MTAIERFLSTCTTPEIAVSLLGKQLRLQTSSGVLTAWITETEAYLGARDAGAHAYQNHQTPRNHALGLDKTLNGQALQPATLSLDLSHYRQPEQVVATPRIGIVNKGEWTTAPLRYFVAGNPFVSKISRRTIDHEHHGWMTR